MSKVCNSINDRILPNDSSGTIQIEDIIGSSVKIISMGQTAIGVHSIIDANKVYTISEIRFRILLDGKCFSVITLSELPDLVFTWDQLKLI